MDNIGPQSAELSQSCDRSLAIAEWKRLEAVKDLTEEAIAAFAQRAELLVLKAGELLVDRESQVTHAYFVVTGMINVELFDWSDDPIQSTQFGRGSVAGLMALVASERASVNIQAVDNTTAFRLPLPELLEISSAHPSFQLFLLRQSASIINRIAMGDRVLPRQSTIALIHLTKSTRQLTPRIASRLQELGENICIAGDDPQAVSGLNAPFRALVSEGKIIDSSERESILREWSNARRLVLDASIENAPAGLVKLISDYAELVLWCVDGDADSSAFNAIRQLVKANAGFREKSRVVWLLDASADVAPFVSDLNQFAKSDFKICFERPRTNQGHLLYRGFDRLIQCLRGVHIGIALGGGAARGMAHLGVLKVLEENGVYVDRIAGTSAGAMTGTTYAAGMDPTYATNCFKNDLRPSWIYRKLPGGGYWYLLHKYRYGLFEGMLRKYLHDFRVEQLGVPITAIAVDLVEGEPVIRTTGDATRNVLASINLPPLSLPIVDSGSALVDGGLLNNVPANVLVSQGCNFVIASTVTAKIEKDFMGVRSQGKSIRRMFANVQVMLRQNLIQSYKMNSVGVQPADFVIAPDVTAFDISEFSRADEIAKIGETTTLAQVEELRKILAKLDPQLFSR